MPLSIERIRAALKESRNNRAAAAKALGVNEQYLRQVIAKLREKGHVVPSNGGLGYREVGRPRAVTFAVGDRAEFSRGYDGDPKIGEPCEILAIEGLRAECRFEDREIRWLLLTHLAWIPKLADYEASKRKLAAEHMAEKRRQGGPTDARDGHPHTCRSEELLTNSDEADN